MEVYKQDMNMLAQENEKEIQRDVLPNCCKLNTSQYILAYIFQGLNYFMSICMLMIFRLF